MEAPEAVPVPCTFSCGTDRGAMWVCVWWLSLPWDVLESFEWSQKVGPARWMEVPQKPSLLRAGPGSEEPVPAHGRAGAGNRKQGCPLSLSQQGHTKASMKPYLHGSLTSSCDLRLLHKALCFFQ